MTDLPQPPARPSQPRPAELPGKGLLGWLGRQVGYVSKAVRQPVTTLPYGASNPAPEAKSAAPAATSPASPLAIYRDEQVVEHPMPGRPGVVLRRTTIDEAIVKPKPDDETPTTA